MQQLSYKSQVGQDRWVCEILNYKREGLFLDIGAFDGVTISNTWVLEKELGWDGLCVEAGKENFEKLKKERKLALNAAVTDKDGTVKFKENWTVGKVGEGDEVQSVTFTTLFGPNQPLEIDYISLDIEGSEYAALTKFPFERVNVFLWTIEHNSHEDGGVMQKKIRDLMSKNGYRLYEGELKPKEAIFEDWYVNELLY